MSLSPGTRLGPYEILAPLGAGGMGEVYRARDTKLDRDIALKALPRDLAEDAERRSRLVAEARAAASLNHPNICTIYDVSEIDGQIYLAMELVEGQPLSARLSERTLPPDDVVRYGLQLADALAHAHDRGLVHRDFKSANVMITPEGRAKVLDFGLAKRVSGQELANADTVAPLTQPGLIVGTVPYMAPEQLRGRAADARSDVWSLGIVLYEMAAGARPFQGQTGFELSSAILSQAPPPLPPLVQAPLRTVISRCLEKEPLRRYQAAEVRAALEAIQQGIQLPSATLEKPVPARSWLMWQMASVAVVAAVGISLGLNVGGFRDRFLSGGAPDRIESLAVLPLTNFSRDPEQEFFADGVTEALIADLAQVSALRVISRTSVMAYKGTRKTVPQIGRELNVDAVLEGSVQRSGTRVLVTAQLVHAGSDRHLWARSYERDMKDVLSLQGEIARSVASEIRAALSPRAEARLTRPQSVDPETHELYLRGRFHASKWTESEIGKGIEYFERALAKNPKYAVAYAGLADSYFMLSDNYRAPAEVLPKAKLAALKALELDQDLAEAHASLGAVHFFWDWDWAAAETELKRAIQLNPGYAAAHDYYSSLLMFALGRPEEGDAENRRALELDPISAMVHINSGWRHFLRRRYAESIAENLKAIDLEPASGLAYGQLALAHAGAGRKAEALSAADKGPQVDDSPLVLAISAGVYATLGEGQKARQALSRLQGITKRRYVCPYEVGIASIGLGDKDEGFRWMEKGFADRSACMPFTGIDPRLDSIRSDPRYLDLVRRLGLPR